jgi:hypothetical protein
MAKHRFNFLFNMTEVENARGKEVVVRGKTVYFRKAFPRGIESANYNRLRTLLYFGEGAWQAYGKSYEEVIKSVQENMKKMPPPERKIEKIVLLDKLDLAALRYKLLKEGYKKGDVIRFPNTIQVINVNEKKEIKQFVL